MKEALFLSPVLHCQKIKYLWASFPIFTYNVFYLCRLLFFRGSFGFFLFFCYHANSLTSKFKCAVEFQVSTWHFSAEWNKHKLCKVSSLSDLCTLDIWKWVHCHVMSLSKDSIWWIFHPSCLQNLFCMHTDVHCIKTLSWPAVFLV